MQRQAAIKTGERLSYNYGTNLADQLIKF